MGNGNLAERLTRDWLRLTLVAWLLIAAFFVWQRWGPIHGLQLTDTDDNMRLMQVRAWMAGQSWFDLRQYRMNPPVGYDMHWSRLVDLPIAGLIVLLRPFVGPREAELLACGIAPLLPLSIAMVALSTSVRRLIAPLAWPVALALLLGCSVTLLMFMPERIDHHGWQLALLSVTVAGLSDPQGSRGGAIVGVASALSLTIGLEMLPYAASAGALLALRWVWDRAEAPRLAVYGLTLGGGCALGYAAFASYADRVARCDALTPVWLTVMVAAGSLLFALAWVNPVDRRVRLALAVAAAAAIVAGFAGIFPQCLGRPEQVSPELEQTWLSVVREAKPIYRHPFRVAFPVVALPVIGVIGAALATWRARGTAVGAAWGMVLLFVTFAALLMLFAARAGPAAQLLAVPGATWLVWTTTPVLLAHRSVFVRVFGTALALFVISGLPAGLAIKYLPIDPPNRYTRVVNRASGLCPTIRALRPLDRLPPQTIFTFVDLGPRLITVTHHDAVAGPYHRNGDAILDVHHAFSRSPEEFRAIARRHGATLLLVCPNMSESTVYRARGKGGFYDRLAHGATYPWLEPLPLPKGSPLRLWRIQQDAVTAG